MIGKKGAAHFEMIVSIVFFVGFVFFLFTMLSPQDESILSDVALSGFYDSFEGRASTTLSSVFLKANYTGAGCFSVVLEDSLFYYDMHSGGSYVEELDGTKVDSGFSGEQLSIDGDGIFFRVAISPEFTDAGLSGCAVLDDYEVGSILEREVISYSTLEEMRGEYSDGYDDLKDGMGIPPIFDFAIVGESSPGVSMEPRSGVPDGVDVIAQDYVLEVLRADGSLINERFILKIW